MQVGQPLGCIQGRGLQIREGASFNPHERFDCKDRTRIGLAANEIQADITMNDSLDDVDRVQGAIADVKRQISVLGLRAKDSADQAVSS